MVRRLPERTLRRLGPHYILWMMAVTRASGSIGGLLVLYYVHLTLTLPENVRRHFEIVALVAVAAAVTLTALYSLWETRRLRRALSLVHRGLPVDRWLGQEAGREAVTFAGRHHRAEAWLVPASTAAPLLIFLRLVDHASVVVLINVSMAAFMGTVMALMSTYFLIAACMRPVIAYLLENGVAIDFDKLPVSRLRNRLNICFSLIILTTALMIGTLARQRAADMVNQPETQQEALANLKAHTSYITIAAVAIGLVFSTVLAQSVAVRVGRLVDSMKRVQAGDLSVRMTPTGNDEIDIVTCQFNAMVSQLDRNDHTIRDLNANLERKVKQRTRQLSKKKRELQASLSQLQEYDRLKTEFFSNVSHELRTPLTMILAPIEEILDKRRGELAGDTGYMLDAALVNGRRLLDLINRLLEFSTLEAGRAQVRLSPVDLGEMTAELVAVAAPLARQRQIELRLDRDADLPVIGADAEKLDSVITNLLSNAMKFTPAGGSVEIKTLRQGDLACVYVRDSGIGISPEDHHRVFERFVQLDGSTSRRYSGTGLGLALVKEIVELHGGRISLESEIGRGTTFWFELPITEPPTEAQRQTASLARSCRFADLVVCDPEEPEAPIEAPQAAPNDAPRVLVVDDTPEMRRLVAGVLKDQYCVFTACDGEEGTQAALREMPDLIISDVMMPVVDGYAFCRRIKSNPATTRIPFVLLTAKADRTMKIEGLDTGADDYLVKPFDAEELRARVRSLLRLRTLDRKLDERNVELEATLAALQATQEQMLQVAHLAGMTEIATGVLHNVGNVLNNVNVSTTVIGERLRRLRIDGVAKMAMLLDEHAADLPGFFAQEGCTDRIRRYLSGVASELDDDQKSLVAEMEFLVDKVQHIRNIIVAEQNYARRVSFREVCDVHKLIEDTLLMHGHSLAKHRVEVRREFDELPAGPLEKSKLLQVVDNLVKNAVESMSACDGPRVLTIRTQRLEADRARVEVTDTGLGIESDDANRIFNFGFTTKASGNGFGLHSAANAMAEMGGSISASSEGLGRGATFVIELCLNRAAPAEEGGVETQAETLALTSV
ncbi:MAG TPA: ATP-binding protein [Pirellulales bacterium]|nr:ATP-binding protein [Pirellulales bacterium]